MKKTRIKHCIILILLLFGILIIFETYKIIFSLVYDIVTTNTNKIYKENWNIDIPNPTKYKCPINQNSKDPSIICLLYYNSENVDILKNKNFFKKIEENEEEFTRKYNVYIQNLFFKELTEKEKQIFMDKLDTESIFNPNNYYAFLEKRKNHFIFEFLILDTTKNILYTISYW